MHKRHLDNVPCGSQDTRLVHSMLVEDKGIQKM